MKKIITQHDILARLLQQEGEAPPLDCNLRGVCRKCRVKLLSGLWLVDGKPVKAPADVLSCRTRLISDSGEVEFEPHAAAGSVSMDWMLETKLPDVPEAVIGVDIGTTTLAAAKLQNGEVTARAAALNPQAVYGADVISRIAAAANDLPRLTDLIRTAVDRLLEELGMEGVKRIAIAGNTVMTSLFHGVDPAPIGTAPFVPDQRVFPEISRYGIPLYTMPCIAGFLGGDLTAGIGETGLAPGEMLVDIGTNCEIIFHSPQGMVGTGAAAGPAFERYGMQAAPGVTAHLDSLSPEVPPGGLCATALVDFLALARREGLLDERGLYTRKEPSFAPSAENVAELLKAKAAIFAGIRSLEKHFGIQAEKICLAGGFARHLDLNNAVAIGMLPEREYRIVGNCALAGACRLAAVPEMMDVWEKYAASCREIPLNALPDFEKLFIGGLNL